MEYTEEAKKYIANNICDFIESLNFNQVNPESPGMNSEVLFDKLIKYYANKDEIISIYDSMGVSYNFPEWLELPYNYSAEKCKRLLKKLCKLHVTNNCIYSGNYGFWLRDMKRYRSFDSWLKNETYLSIPWQLFLKNNHLLEDGVWAIIKENIKNNRSHSSYFKRLPEYQDIHKEKALFLFNHLEDKIRSARGNLFKRHYLPLMSKDYQISEKLNSDYQAKGFRKTVIENDIPKEHVIGFLYHSKCN